jgi:peptidase E
MLYDFFEKIDARLGQYEFQQKAMRGNISIQTAIREYCYSHNKKDLYKINEINELVSFKIYKYLKHAVLRKEKLEEQIQNSENRLFDALVLSKGNESLYVTESIQIFHGGGEIGARETEYVDTHFLKQLRKIHPELEAESLKVLFVSASRPLSGQMEYFRKFAYYYSSFRIKQENMTGLFFARNIKEATEIVEKAGKTGWMIFPDAVGVENEKQLKDDLIDLAVEKSNKEMEQVLKNEITMEEFIRRREIIYLGGGDPNIQLARLFKCGAGKAIRKYARIKRGYMGLSAGAMSGSSRSVCYDGKDKIYADVEGLGLMENLLLQVHFNVQCKPLYLEELYTKYPNSISAGADDNTAIAERKRVLYSKNDTEEIEILKTDILSRYAIGEGRIVIFSKDSFKHYRNMEKINIT